MDLASQTQRHLTMRAFGSTPNGSQPPYHPSLGSAFSASRNKFRSLGMVVEGDAARVASEKASTSTVTADTGLDYEGLSGPAQHVLAMHHPKMATTGVTAGLAAGVLLVYAGLDFPFAENVIKGIKNIKLDRAFRSVALVGGAVLIGQNMGGA
jgi:hypothetical protein